MNSPKLVPTAKHELNMENETKDLSWEHEQHRTYQEGCSTCWGEALKVKLSKSAFAKANREMLSEKDERH